jgi:uncharacterized repeat protein (TIGR03837 family)
VDVFCHVIDNYGDAAVCWRVARQLAREHAARVTLWIDHLAPLHKIVRGVDAHHDTQEVEGVLLRKWVEPFPPLAEVPDAVLEGFGCRIPDAYVAAMLKKTPLPAWINLEYLSAEQWVETCHGRYSPHAFTSLKKYFYFPGFTAGTGGLIREHGLLTSRRHFRRAAANADAFLRALGVGERDLNSDRVSLFCYPSAPVDSLFSAWCDAHDPVLCLVPEGVAEDTVSAFIRRPVRAGERETRGALTVQVLPMLPQDDYDRLLWSCHLNFVRGEDSFVRAQWAASPFVWHLYPQEVAARHAKLEAFLQRYLAGFPADMHAPIRDFSLSWNGIRPGNITAASWYGVRKLMREWGKCAEEWEETLTARGDFTSDLFEFINALLIQ